MIAIDEAYAPSSHRLTQQPRGLAKQLIRLGNNEALERRHNKLLVPFEAVDDDLKRMLRSYLAWCRISKRLLIT